MKRRRPATIPEVSTPDAPAQSLQLKPPRRSPLGSVIGHTGFSVALYHSTAVFGAIFPVLAGLLMFGWRAGVVLMSVLISTALAGSIWRRIGKWGNSLRPAQLLWLGLVLALMLPADLTLHRDSGQPALWPILPAAGLLLVIFSWMLGSFCPGRLHPTVAVLLLLALFYGPMLSGRAVLQRNHLLTGDLAITPPPKNYRAIQLPWRRTPVLDYFNAVSLVPPAQSLIEFTTNRADANPMHGSLEILLRDRLPPLEDLVLGSCPGPIGGTSAIAIIVGGLFLLYRGLIDFRIPLLITVTAWIALLILPIPSVTSQPGWTWLPGHARGVGWALGVTFANYEVLGSPLLFMAFFLAGSPTVRPLGKRGRAVYAMLIGMLAAVFQLYFSVAFGGYFALLLVGLLTPALDRYLASKPLV